MKNIILRFSVAIFALIFISLPVNAQYRTDVFAITNARIVTVSGAAIEKGTVVIRDGLIESVGANARVPADAVTIDGTGPTADPGIVDALTNLPTAPTRPPGGGGGGGGGAAAAQQAPTSNSNYPAGLRPEDLTADEIRSGDA